MKIIKYTTPVVLTILIMEIVLRLVNFPVSLDKNWLKLIKFDPILGWNRREPETVLNINGSKTILCLGDSGTFGINRDTHDCVPYTAYLHRLLPEYKIINAGVIGYTSNQGLRKYQLLGIKPDFVIVRFMWNDGRSNITFADYNDKYVHWYDHLAIYQWTHAVLKHRQKITRVDLKEYIENLKAFKEIYPNAEVIYLDYPLKDENYKYFTEELEKLTPVHTYCEGYFNSLDSVHPSQVGAENIARKLVTRITHDADAN